MPSDTPPFLERVALRYFEARSAAVAVQRDDRIDLLNERERAAMRAIERGAILRSGLAGALSSVVSGAAEVYADAHLPVVSGSHGTVVLYWGFVLGWTAIASVFEILFLYWDALRSVHALAGAAGLPFDDFTGTSVASAMARAALELPNSPEPVLGVNPHRESSKARLAAAALLYKGKIALTTFLFKLIIRRVLARAAVRGVGALVLPFVAVPVTAVWNGLVTFLVVREARVRAIGPFAINEAFSSLLRDVPGRGHLREVLVRAVASTIVRKQNLHPNLRTLLTTVAAEVDPEQLPEVDSPERFLAELTTLGTDARRIALKILCIAIVIDGRTTRREHGLVANASRTAGIDVARSDIEKMRRSFVRGDGLTVELVQALTGQASPASGAAAA